MKGLLLFFALLGGEWAIAQTQNSINIQSMNSEINASLESGTDIGAKVNSAIAALSGGCGTVLIPAGSYSFTTEIVKPRCVNLHGQSGFGTTLNWTQTSGAAIAAADSSGVNNYPDGEIADLTINGPGGTNTAIGVYIGGDPAGVIDPSGAYGDHQNLNRVRITGFGAGVQWGNNSWSDVISQSLISSNTTGLYFPSGLTNAGESLSVIGTSTQNNQTGLNLVGFSDFYFYASRCDYNTTCGNVNAAHFYGEHFEQSSGTILTITGTSQPHVEIYGGWAQLSATSGTDAQMFYVNSNLNPLFRLSGTFVLANHTVTDLVNWNGSGGAAVLDIESLPHHPSVSTLTNTACNFWGCIIIDTTTGIVAMDGKSFSVSNSGTVTALSVTTTQNGAGASIGNVGGFAEIQGNGTGLRLDSTNGASTTPIYFTNGSLNATGVSITATSYIPTSSTTAPTGSCAVAGTLEITGDGHATYCKAGTMIWTNLY